MPVTCDPATLANSAHCFDCVIPGGAQLSVQTYLLAQIAGVGTSEAAIQALANNARCFASCIPPGELMAVQTYLLAQLAGLDSAEAYTGVNLGVITSDETGCGGFEFVPDVNITVTSVARWFLTGNVLTHFVGIYQLAGPLLGGATVTFSGSPERFVYADLATPIQLTAGTHYVVAAQEYPFPIVESFYQNLSMPPGTTPTGVNSHISIIASRNSLNCGVNTFVGSGTFGVDTYGPVNFKFTA